MLFSGYEGRAGMAAVVLKDGHDLDGDRLYAHLLHTLPPYAWPWFLRVQVQNYTQHIVSLHGLVFECAFPAFVLQTSLDVTDTFKQRKGKLVEQGFSPDTVQQPLYFLDTSVKDYIPLTVPLYQDIISGKIRL